MGPSGCGLVESWNQDWGVGMRIGGLNRMG